MRRLLLDSFAMLCWLQEGKGSETVDDLLEKAEAEQDDWFEKLPQHPTAFFEGLSDWYNDWLNHPEDGPYWWQFNIEKYHDQIETPMLHQGGWFDVFQTGSGTSRLV